MTKIEENNIEIESVNEMIETENEPITKEERNSKEIMKTKVKIQNLENCSDFDVTVNDRNIVQINQVSIEEDPSCNIEFENARKQIMDKAMLWRA